MTSRRLRPVTTRPPSPAAMMTRALVEARRAGRIGEVPVGAVVYRGGELIAAASNRRHHAHDPVAHAEIDAIRAAAAVVGDWRLSECTLAVTLEPCPMCAGAIVNARIGRLIYGAVDPKAGAVESLYRLCDDARLNHRPIVVGRVLADPCGELLRAFFAARRNRGPLCNDRDPR